LRYTLLDSPSARDLMVQRVFQACHIAPTDTPALNVTQRAKVASSFELEISSSLLML
jgi:hypothetical protein